jgi:hypothetical protein
MKEERSGSYSILSTKPGTLTKFFLCSTCRLRVLTRVPLVRETTRPVPLRPAKLCRLAVNCVTALFFQKPFFFSTSCALRVELVLLDIFLKRVIFI